MEFKEFKLGDIADIIMGQSPKGDSYNQNMNGIPFLQGNRTFGRIYPCIDTWTTSPIKVALKESVLMSVRAPVGDLNITKENVCIGRGLCSIRGKYEKSMTEYLYYLLRNSMNNLKEKSSGTVFESINKNDLENLVILLPTLEDQNKIVKILSDVDKKIELNNKINNNLYEIGLSLLNNYFNTINDKVLLKEVITFVKGKKPKNISEKKEQNYLKYLTIAGLNGQGSNYADTEKMLIANQDLLMVMDGASSGDIYYSDYGVVGSTLSRLDIVDKKYTKEYIFFCLKKYSILIKSKNTGSAIPHTDKVFVGSLEIPELDKEKQIQFKTLLEKVQDNQKENETLTKLRDTLLPKLMNGEIDLENIEI